MSVPCDVCGLVDPYRGQGDGIGSCDCPRCDGCGLADGSALCGCPAEDDYPDGAYDDEDEPGRPIQDVQTGGLT